MLSAGTRINSELADPLAELMVPDIAALYVMT